MTSCIKYSIQFWGGLIKHSLCSELHKRKRKSFFFCVQVSVCGVCCVWFLTLTYLCYSQQISNLFSVLPLSVSCTCTTLSIITPHNSTVKENSKGLCWVVSLHPIHVSVCLWARRPLCTGPLLGLPLGKIHMLSVFGVNDGWLIMLLCSSNVQSICFLSRESSPAEESICPHTCQIDADAPRRRKQVEKTKCPS